jgi:hypothetical protein
MVMSSEPARRPRRHWTAAIYTRMNPAMRSILRSRCHRLFSGRTVLLGITGRRTGRYYEISVGYSQPDDHTIDVLVSDASNRTWWRNFVDGGPIRVVHRGRPRSGRATAHRAPSLEFKTIADRAIPGIVGSGGASRFFALDHFDPSAGLRDEDLHLLTGFAVAVEITLDEP